MKANYSGIYKIQSKARPELMYIGQSKNIYKRWKRHLGMLRNNNHENYELQSHYNSYGEDDLVFSILFICSVKNLASDEKYFIEKYKPYWNTNLRADLEDKYREQPKQWTLNVDTSNIEKFRQYFKLKRSYQLYNN